MWRPRQRSLKQRRGNSVQKAEVGGRDRPVEVRIQQEAERCQSWGPSEDGPTGVAEEADPWLAGPTGKGRLCLLQKPLSKTLASLQLTKAR